MSKWRFAWQPHAIDDRATVTVAWKQVGNKSETMSKCRFARQDYAVCNRATVRATRKQVGNKSEAMSKYTFFVAGLCNSPQCHGEVTTETCRKQIGNNLQDADLHGRAMQFATGPRLLQKYMQIQCIYMSVTCKIAIHIAPFHVKTPCVAIQ